jgi:hypothetical protein
VAEYLCLLLSLETNNNGGGGGGGNNNVLSFERQVFLDGFAAINFHWRYKNTGDQQGLCKPNEPSGRQNPLALKPLW